MDFRKFIKRLKYSQVYQDSLLEEPIQDTTQNVDNTPSFQQSPSKETITTPTQPQISLEKDRIIESDFKEWSKGKILRYYLQLKPLFFGSIIKFFFRTTRI